MPVSSKVTSWKQFPLNPPSPRLSSVPHTHLFFSGIQQLLTCVCSTWLYVNQRQELYLLISEWSEHGSNDSLLSKSSYTWKEVRDIKLSYKLNLFIKLCGVRRGREKIRMILNLSSVPIHQKDLPHDPISNLDFWPGRSGRRLTRMTREEDVGRLECFLPIPARDL